MGLKNFDFFQKITVDNVTQPTLIGSLLSLSAISIAILLLIREVMDFYSPQVKTDSIVLQDENTTEKIKLNLNLKFNHLPCGLLALDQEDSLRNHRSDISDTVRKNIITKAGAIEGVDKNKQMMENDLFTAIQNGEGCMLRGHLDISKVPGDIHVSFHSYRGKWNALKARRPDLASKINMAHQFISLSFGNMEQYKLFKYGILPRSFYRYGEMPDFLSKNINQNYIYYIKLIPYTFIDENNGSINHSYQYSISYKEQEFDPREDDMPIVLVKYEFSPVTMRVTIPKRDYLHFLTHVCAIVGGIFVVFSILNRFLVGLFDFSGK